MFSTAVYFAVYYWQAIYSGIFSRLELLPRHALARRRRHRFPPEARARCSLPRFVSALAKPFLCSLVSRSASPIYLLGSGCHGFLDSRPAGAPPLPLPRILLVSCSFAAGVGCPPRRRGRQDAGEGAKGQGSGGEGGREGESRGLGFGAIMGEVRDRERGRGWGWGRGGCDCPGWSAHAQKALWLN